MLLVAELWRAEILKEALEARANQGRATTDIAQAARAATVGAVDSMLMDIDETLPGRIAKDGAVVFAEQLTATNCDLVDEIATRVITTGGRVIGVRKADSRRGACDDGPKPTAKGATRRKRMSAAAS